MGWTDNREQGLTGRKRPCAPRSSQLQTSITMIIYPVLTKCTVSMFHQRPVNRHCIGKFMGTGSQGQVGKLASHWWLPGKGGKKHRKKICLLHCWKNNLLQSICTRQHLLPCCWLFFFFFPLLPVWVRNGSILTKSWLQGLRGMVPSNFLVLESPGAQPPRTLEWNAGPSLSPLLQGTDRTTCSKWKFGRTTSSQGGLWPSL